MRKFLSTATALTAVALVLTGCSGSQAASSSDADASGPLVVYTNSYDSGRAEWLTKEAKTAGFDIKIVEAGGADVKNKIVAEKNNPVADVAFGLSQFYFSQLVDEGTIEAYKPSWADEVDTELGDQSGKGAFWPLVQQAILLTYDADRTSEADAPTDWTDLWTDPAYKGRYETKSELGSTTSQVLLASILSRYTDKKGDLGISDEGWKQVQEYYANGVPENDNDLFKNIADGSVDYGALGSSSIAGAEKTYGFTAGIVKPSVGSPFIAEQVAVIKGSKRVKTAEKFIDWFGSAETQTAWSKNFSSMPVNKEAIAKVDPAIVDFYGGLKKQDIDWSLVAKNLPDWVEKVGLEYNK